jgi:hypothetical protein
MAVGINRSFPATITTPVAAGYGGGGGAYNSTNRRFRAGQGGDRARRHRMKDT